MFEKNKNDEAKTVSLLEAFMGYIGVVSLLNIVLLTANFFYPLLSLFIGLVLILLILFVFKINVTLKHPQFHWLLLIIVVIAILFRITPNIFLTGGQDQGTYVSLSKQYEINKGLYIKDELRSELPESIKRAYDKGSVILGVDPKDKDNSEFIMPFYPVLPSWMAIFGSVFGSDNRVYALTFFGVLSVVGIYLFSYEISNRNKKVALLTSLFVSINPVFVYFSRIPLTELVYLTFLMFSLYFLVKYYNEYKINGGGSTLYLALSLLLANSSFYTRMNGVFLLLIILLLPALLALFSKDKRATRNIFLYSVLWIISFAFSYYYYYLYITPLFDLIIGKRILSYVDTNTILLAIGILLLGVVVVLYIERVKRLVKSILLFISKHFFITLLVLFILLILYSLYAYINTILLDTGYSLLSSESLSAFKQLPFITTLLYLSPVGFVLLPLSFLFMEEKRDIRILMLGLGFVISLIYCWVVLESVPYHYYYVRYQLTELLPFSLIFISLFLIQILQKRVWSFMVVLFISIMSLYFGYFSVIQLRDYEGADRSVYMEINELVEEDDLLIIEREEFVSFNQIVLPLKYYYNLNVFPFFSHKYFGNATIKQVAVGYEDVYVLSTKENLEEEGFKLVKEVTFKHNYLVHCLRSEDAYFEMESHSEDIPLCEYIIIPNRYYYGVYDMYLYKWN